MQMTTQDIPIVEIWFCINQVHSQHACLLHLQIGAAYKCIFPTKEQVRDNFSVVTCISVTCIFAKHLRSKLQRSVNKDVDSLCLRTMPLDA